MRFRGSAGELGRNWRDETGQWRLGKFFGFSDTVEVGVVEGSRCDWGSIGTTGTLEHRRGDRGTGAGQWRGAGTHRVGVPRRVDVRGTARTDRTPGGTGTAPGATHGDPGTGGRDPVDRPPTTQTSETRVGVDAEVRPVSTGLAVRGGGGGGGRGGVEVRRGGGGPSGGPGGGREGVGPGSLRSETPSTGSTPSSPSSGPGRVGGTASGRPTRAVPASGASRLSKGPSRGAFSVSPTMGTPTPLPCPKSLTPWLSDGWTRGQCVRN